MADQEMLGKAVEDGWGEGGSQGGRHSADQDKQVQDEWDVLLVSSTVCKCPQFKIIIMDEN